jgi:hypothetical protein
MDLLKSENLLEDTKGKFENVKKNPSNKLLIPQKIPNIESNSPIISFI